MNCKQCKKPMKIINAHWTDPMVKCTNKNCSEFGYTPRMSQVNPKRGVSKCS
ncbi:hypothetical protein VP142E351_P0039 [Vibrio phage 142E35-1]|nr:hypothetical protein VP142E351_P0039 [Vibrio phage 142E35-1]